MPFGNVNVKYKSCKSVGQLKAAADYMLGKKLDQLYNGITKTENDLYSALGCNRDNFANNILVTRKLQGKSYSKMKENNILAHKMSISFHPDDNDKINHHEAFLIAQEFAEKYAHSKGYEVLFCVHTDTEHIHAHFLISNCNMQTGLSYRRSQKDLYEMSEFLGDICRKNDLINSIRNDFYNHNLDKAKDRLSFAEKEMRKRGVESFKDELREVIQHEVADPNNKTFDDVISGLKRNWNVECRVKGNTVSFKHPEHKDKNDNLVSVRGSKLGDLYTMKGINHELNKKPRRKPKRAAEFDYAARGIETAVGANNDVGIGHAEELGGQIQADFNLRQSESNLQDFDRFYDRYAKPVEEPKPEPVRTVKRTTTIHR